MGSPEDGSQADTSQERLDKRSRGLNEEHKEGQDNIKNRTRHLDPTTEEFKKSRGGG